MAPSIENNINVTASTLTPRSSERSRLHLRGNNALNNTPHGNTSVSSRFQQSPSLFSPAKATPLPYKAVNENEYGHAIFSVSKKTSATKDECSPEMPDTKSHRRVVLFTPTSTTRNRTARVSRQRANPSTPGISFQRDSFGQPIVNRLR